MSANKVSKKKCKTQDISSSHMIQDFKDTSWTFMWTIHPNKHTSARNTAEVTPVSSLSSLIAAFLKSSPSSAPPYTTLMNHMLKKKPKKKKR